MIRDFLGANGWALRPVLPAPLSGKLPRACHAGEEHASRVLLAMGIPAEEALGAVRLSLGRGTTEDEVERAATLLLAAARGFTSR